MLLVQLDLRFKVFRKQDYHTAVSIALDIAFAVYNNNYFATTRGLHQAQEAGD